MAQLVALLHAVNVGGTGMLAMAELRRLCAELGFEDPRTYIASGNVVFGTHLAAATARTALEAALRDHVGRAMRVSVRTGPEMRAVADANPWPDGPVSRVIAFFVDTVPDDPGAGARGGSDEEIAAGPGVVYVHYPSGQGRSKLKIPAAREATGRNMNTVAKLAGMAGA